MNNIQTQYLCAILLLITFPVSLTANPTDAPTTSPSPTEETCLTDPLPPAPWSPKILWRTWEEYEALARLAPQEEDADLGAIAPFTVYGPTMHHAAYRGDLHLLNIMITRGENIEELNELGYTPLQWAVKSGQIEVVRALLQHNANIHFDKFLVDPLNLLINSSHRPENHIAIIELLVECGADINSKNPTRGMTVLQFAIANRRPDIVSWLIDHGVEIDAKGYEGQTALELAEELSVDNCSLHKSRLHEIIRIFEQAH